MPEKQTNNNTTTKIVKERVFPSFAIFAAGFSPTAYQKWMTPDGDRKAALAADNLDAPIILSAHATTRMEDVVQEMVNGEEN